jgi:hypothetical protein
MRCKTRTMPTQIEAIGWLGIGCPSCGVFHGPDLEPKWRAAMAQREAAFAAALEAGRAHREAQFAAQTQRDFDEFQSQLRHPWRTRVIKWFRSFSQS